MNYHASSALTPKGPLEQTLRSPLFATGAICLVLASIMMLVVLGNQFEQQWQQQFTYQSQQLTEETASNASPFLQSRNIISLNLLLKRILSREEVVAGSISDGAGEVLTELNDHYVPGRVVPFKAPVTLDSQLLGYVTLIFHPEQKRNGSALITMLLSAIAIVIWFLVCMWLTARQQAELRQFNSIMTHSLDSSQNSLSGWNQYLETELFPALSIAGHLSRRMDDDDLNQLRGQLEEPPLTGRYLEGCLLYIAPVFARQDQNADPSQMERWLERQELYLHHVAQLYDGEITQDRHCLVFGLNGDPDQAMVNALCAAQVLHHLCGTLIPHAISLSSGTLWVASTHYLPPAIQVQGNCREELHMIHLHNNGQHLLMAENMFQYGRVNELVEASIDRDLNLPDGRRLEIWRLDGLKENYEQLLLTQADNLLESL